MRSCDDAGDDEHDKRGSVLLLSGNTRPVMRKESFCIILKRQIKVKLQFSHGQTKQAPDLS